MATEPRGPGGIALRAWLDQSGMNIPAFAERLGIDRVHLQRMVSGERAKRVNRALAVLIERETDGAVLRTVWYGEDDAVEVLHDAEATSPDAAA